MDVIKAARQSLVGLCSSITTTFCVFVQQIPHYFWGYGVTFTHVKKDTHCKNEIVLAKYVHSCRMAQDGTT